ncbi:hypothetical protein HQ393_01745 [Chitinibacter bivalviorum]|uniref:Uncharacterized protein n=1 Tax=Chitinibacter bivalviorum TaxID=2739434 RepID=A0A7H9BES9_9NEIS|nr:hypothetical protein [Chitinibacter bivalviorum]QLG87067.1 hypothetical protein HQ393_01745 [Chitinibacter bivalviorum]
MMQNHPTLRAPILDGMAAGADNGLAALNHAAETGNSDKLADKPLHSGIFTSALPLVRLSLASRGGDTFGYAGSNLPVFPDPALCSPPRLETWSGLIKPKLEARPMPKHARTLLQYLTLITAVLAFERNTPLIVVALAVAVFLLSHVIGGRNHG